MPNPTTLTVPVPVGVGNYKVASAIEVALCVSIYWKGAGDGFILVTPEYEYEEFRLNPNVLDPEDTDLVCRVLGAVVRRKNQRGVWLDYHWRDGMLCLCKPDGSPLLSPHPTNIREGFELSSIPSLGLTRDNNTQNESDS